MKRYLSVLGAFGLVMALPFVLRLYSNEILAWQAGQEGRTVLGLLKNLPYGFLALSAVWAARIANTPVYVLSLILIPAQYYFSGGAVYVGGGEQMRFVLFMLLPVIVTISSLVSHQTLASNLKTGITTLACGFIFPPIVSAVVGRSILEWVGSYRWGAAGILGAPSSPTLYYLGVLLLLLLLPFRGREGRMKKILAALIPCYYFSGVFRPIFRSGPLHPSGTEETIFILFTSLAPALMLYANGFLSWSKAYVDDLTQVLGRRALNEALAHLQGSYSIAMVDIDHFKKFNDTYGHAAGDVVLKEVAALLSEKCGGQVYRYGGEEFSVLYPDTDIETAAGRIDEARGLLAATKFSLNGASKGRREKKVTVNISVGVSESGKKYSTAEEVIRAADSALYKAKENGRNRVERS